MARVVGAGCPWPRHIPGRNNQCVGHLDRNGMSEMYRGILIPDPRSPILEPDRNEMLEKMPHFLIEVERCVDICHRISWLVIDHVGIFGINGNAWWGHTGRHPVCSWEKQMAVSSFSSTQISKEEAVFSSIAMAIHIPTTTQNISDNCSSSLSFFSRK